MLADHLSEVVVVPHPAIRVRDLVVTAALVLLWLRQHVPGHVLIIL